MTHADYDARASDARLLAAALDLLAALRHAERNVTSMLYMLPLSADPVERQSLTTWAEGMRAAIAKAEGGQ